MARVSGHVARGNQAVEVRLDDEARERWRVGAAARGYTLSEFIRACVESELTAAAAAPAKPKPPTRTAKKDAERAARSGLCAHRIGPEQYCSRCDA
jgi:hypothetical protein